ncbi:MAG: hypothetical protein JXA57_04785 [Armatimonadetes bacterium]|nr:hypothetical protein [Armatimonadota bacterium]
MAVGELKHRGRYNSFAAGLLVVLGLLAAGAIWRTGAGVQRGPNWTMPFLWGYAAAWVCYVAAGVTVSRERVPRWVVIWIVVVAIGLRVVALARTPPLSTDVWRYLWDGRVANAGINPFQYAPDAEEVRHLRDANWRHINFKHISTIYPPAGQLLFAGLARVRTVDAKAFAWTFALFDIGNVLLLIALLRRTGNRPARAIWYAWCPLAVTEATAGSHVDPVALFFLLLAFLLTDEEGRPGPASGVTLAASVMGKGYAILALPFFLKRGRWRFIPPFVVTCAALLAPYLGAGTQLFTGFRAYLSAWETNSSLFLLLDRNLARVTPDHFVITRAATVASVLIVIATLVRQQRGGLGWLIGASFTVLGAQLFVGAPTLPWYVLWLLPLLCWRALPGLVLFTLTVSVQYYARWLYPEDRSMHYALLWAGYAPVYLLLAAQRAWWWRCQLSPRPNRVPSD